jgi:hypothetical protein
VVKQRDLAVKLLGEDDCIEVITEMMTMLLEDEWTATDYKEEPCCAYCHANSNLFSYPKKKPENHNEFCDWLVLMKKLGLR